MCLIQEHLSHNYADKFHLRDGQVSHNCHVCCASFLMIMIWERRCVNGNKNRINLLLMRIPWINICSKNFHLLKFSTDKKKKINNLVHVRVWKEYIKCKDITEIIGVQRNVQHTWLFISCFLQMLTAEVQCSLIWGKNSFQVLLGIGNSIQKESVLYKRVMHMYTKNFRMKPPNSNCCSIPWYCSRDYELFYVD